ncbi:prepilin-type N-terminal cleavage/methylation domain-containing protein [Plesiomonas shigelloides]|uniref:prepilin-type N-terminal cleavage/methylation domain-containing protein n=1 Tax=Plesiomonas shigelloides TaxID=703 RepID=UPI002245841C|nr:prepilin-type N-terminal cleavage/methylation domain-containing protein [Plesiomonas shigelloides]MCX2532316.1 prepilin-type N-terminal cleavage/methylation domain-containing protein [Plesiomonas shigelloides]
MQLMRSQGFSLIELLIAMVLGSGVLLAIGSMLSFSNATLNALEQQQRLDNELSSIALKIRKDIRRAGAFEHNATIESKSNIDFFSLRETGSAIIGKPYFRNYIAIASNGECSIFTYDLNKDGCVGAKPMGADCFQGDKNNTIHPLGEVFGYRKKGNVIEMTNNTMLNATQPVVECIRPGVAPGTGEVSCNDSIFSTSLCNNPIGNWEAITDSRFMRIDTFSLERITDSNSNAVVGSGDNAVIYPRYQLNIRAVLVSNPAIRGEINQIITLENPLR